MTLFFRVANVDDAGRQGRTSRLTRTTIARSPRSWRRRARAAKFPIPRKGVGLYKTLQPGVWRINTTRCILKLDGTDVRDLTEAEIEGREQVQILLRFFREYLPGFENCTLSTRPRRWASARRAGSSASTP